MFRARPTLSILYLAAAGTVHAQMPVVYGPPAPVAGLATAVPIPAPLPPPQKLSAAEVFSHAEGLVFKLNTRLIGSEAERAHGTSFVVGTEGYLITNFHVVADALAEPTKYELVLQTPGKPLLGKVISIDAVNDLALVKVAKVFDKALKLSAAAIPAVGDVLYSIGFPKSEQISIIQGNFNGERWMGFAPVFTTSMPLNPGMSGGPTLNEFGDVVGVNRAIMTNAQNISYLSPLAALTALAQHADTKREAASVGAPAKADWRAQIPLEIRQQEILGLGRTQNQNARQKIGRVSFAVPLASMQCGQDAVETISKVKSEVIVCHTSSLALLGADIESLQLDTVGVHQDFIIETARAFGPIEGKYLKMKNRKPPRKDSARESTREPASIADYRPRPAPEKCAARSVRNGRGVAMSVRFCAIGIAEFPGLFSTFVKINIENAGKGSTSLAQSYEGMSMDITGKMVESFLESIAIEPN